MVASNSSKNTVVRKRVCDSMRHCLVPRRESTNHMVSELLLYDRVALCTSQFASQKHVMVKTAHLI